MLRFAVYFFREMLACRMPNSALNFNLFPTFVALSDYSRFLIPPTHAYAQPGLFLVHKSGLFLRMCTASRKMHSSTCFNQVSNNKHNRLVIIVVCEIYY